MLSTFISRVPRTAQRQKPTFCFGSCVPLSRWDVGCAHMSASGIWGAAADGIQLCEGEDMWFFPQLLKNKEKYFPTKTICSLRIWASYCFVCLLIKKNSRSIGLGGSTIPTSDWTDQEQKTLHVQSSPKDNLKSHGPTFWSEDNKG